MPVTGGRRVKVAVPWGGRRPCALARPTPPPRPISDWTGASLSSIQVSSTASHSASFLHAAASLSARRLSTLAPRPPHLCPPASRARRERPQSSNSVPMLLGTIWRGAALAVAGEFQLSFPLSPALSPSLCPRSSPGNGASLHQSSTTAVVYNTSIRRLADAVLSSPVLRPETRHVTSMYKTMPLLTTMLPLPQPSRPPSPAPPMTPTTRPASRPSSRPTATSPSPSPSPSTTTSTSTSACASPSTAPGAASASAATT